MRQAALAEAWTRRAVLTVEEMARADRLAARAGGSFRLMQAAGEAIVAALRQQWPDAGAFDIVCGPGNNGGDGYVAARLLAERGSEVAVWRLAEPSSGDGRRAAAECPCIPHPLAEFTPDPGRVAVDALFGAGLTRPLGGAAVEAWRKIEAAGMPVCAVDLPSGLSGNSGQPLGETFRADLTVTFARNKPAHLLYPGRKLCGRVTIAGIGIDDPTIAEVAPHIFENGPELWRGLIPWPEADTHKYRRGHLAVCSGPAAATGAARLCAGAGARAGAGAVTLLSPADALAVNAAHLTAIMLRRIDTAEELTAFVDKARVQALALGPGFGDLGKARDFALAALRHERASETQPGRIPLVLDADGISAFREDPSALFEAAASAAPRLVLTPHEGEFARLFPDLAEDGGVSKLDKASAAAKRSNAVVVLKGADTVVAEPAGRVVVNTNATPFLATAGSGDVLTGLCGGLLAQGMAAFEAACAAVWLHAEAGRRFGPGLTADDLPDAVRPVLRDLAPAD